MLKLIAAKCPSLVPLLGHVLLNIVSSKEAHKEEDARLVAGQLLQHVRTGVDNDVTVDDYSIELALLVLKEADAVLAGLSLDTDDLELYFIPMDFNGSIAIVFRHEVH